MSDGGGQTVPEVNEPGSSAIGGRGLGIVERLSLRWGVYSARGGAGEVTVWAELSLAAEDEHSDSGSGLVIASSRDA